MFKHEVGMLARKNDNGQAALWRIFKNQTTCPTAFNKEKVLLRALWKVRSQLYWTLDTGIQWPLSAPSMIN